MRLVIVESPTKARTLSRYLGKGYEIAASMGHVRDLPKKTLGVDIKHDFKPEYVVVSGKEDVVKELRLQAKKALEIYLSMDPDREGEAIAFHVKKLIGANRRFKRVVFHQITKSAIEDAFLHPRGIDINLVDSQQARRVLDRLVGYTLSPLLWKKVRRGLSAGRVQSVTVRLIVERERKIEAFVPEEYWEIGVELSKSLGRKAMCSAHGFRKSMERRQKLKIKLRLKELFQILSQPYIWFPMFVLKSFIKARFLHLQLQGCSKLLLMFYAFQQEGRCALRSNCMKWATLLITAPIVCIWHQRQLRLHENL